MCVLGEGRDPVVVADDGTAEFPAGPKSMISVYLREEAALSLNSFPINI